jgi:hypothetical protein
VGKPLPSDFGTVAGIRVAKAGGAVKIDLSKPFRVEQREDGAEDLTITIRKPRPGTGMDWTVKCGRRRPRPVHGPEGAIMLVTMGIFALAHNRREIRSD